MSESSPVSQNPTISTALALGDQSLNNGGAPQVMGLHPGSLTLADHKALLELTSAHIVCFFFPDLSIEEGPHSDCALRLWSSNSSCVEANSSFAALRGYSDRKTLLGKSFADLFPKNETNLKLFRTWASQNFSLSNFENPECSREGSDLLLLTSVYTIREKQFIRKVWVISRDITVRRQAMHSLKEAEEHYRTLVERPGLVLVRTRPNGEYVYITPHVEGIIGYTPEDFKNTPGLFGTLLHPEDVKKHDDVILGARLQRAKQIVEVEYRLRCKDGSYRWFFERQTPKLGEYGQVEYYDSIAFDIQDRKLLEAKLLHAQRMEVIGTLTGGIAHDFNNYLTAILGHLRLAMDKLSVDSAAYENVSGAEYAALRCAEITNDLLCFGRKSDFELRALSLKDLVEETVDLLRRLLPSTIEIITDLPEHPLGIRGNAAQLQQVLINLAVNARDAMPDGGLLRVHARTFAVDNLTQSRRYPDAGAGNYVEIAVADSGRGIPEAHLPYLFDPFFTTKPQGKGTGLGLSMVYSILQNHNGWIHVESADEGGAVFSFIVPTAALPLAAPDPEVTISLCRGTECILVADDDENVLPMVATALSMHGYSVILAKDGHEAVERFKENSRRIDLALIDHTMPKGNGRVVLDAIRAIAPDVRVILTSGYGELANDTCADDGCHTAFIKKPYLIPDLLNEVRRLIDQGSPRRNIF